MSDIFVPNADDLTPQQKAEIQVKQLIDLADNINAYQWQYDGDNELHDGVILQDVLKVPGLKDCVREDKDGVLCVPIDKIGLITLANLGYISTLAKLLLEEMEANGRFDKPFSK